MSEPRQITDSATNPLLKAWVTPFATPPFDEIKPEHFLLLERTYTRFHRSGAGLSDEAKTRMAEINEKLAQLGTGFSHHLLGDEQEWFMELGEADRQGLSESFVAAAKAAAEERGM